MPVVVDAGDSDAGSAARLDAGEVDAGVVDAGEVDAGVVDAGVVDAGEVVDAGAVDAGDADASVRDAGAADGGGDAGTPDASFDIAAVPGLVIWLRGDRIDLDDAGTVARWPDQSGNGNHALPRVVRPLVERVSAPNGLSAPGVKFGDGNDGLEISDHAGLQFGTSAFDIIAMVRWTNPSTDYGTIIAKQFATYPHPGIALWANDTEVEYPSASLHLSIDRPNTKSYVKGSNRGSVLLVHASRLGDVTTLREGGFRNSLTYAPATDVSAPGTPFSIGSRGGGFQQLQGHVLELIVIRGGLSESDRRAMNAALYARYPIALVPTQCSTSGPTQCNENAFCNGIELCAPADPQADDWGCVNGTPPCAVVEACSEASKSCLISCRPPFTGTPPRVSCPNDCQDGIFCNGVEVCTTVFGISCVAAPGARPCAAGFTCNETARRCDCATNSQCDDSLFCNGQETCNPTAPGRDSRGCVSGTRPCAMSCSETMDRCFASCIDEDGDGACSGTGSSDDCDDANPFVYPGATESCTPGAVSATRDEDCNPQTIGTTDADGDGFVDARCSNPSPLGPPRTGTDCNDANSAVHPNQTDPCNGRDDDCDTFVDEDGTTLLYQDLDQDGQGTSVCMATGCVGMPNSSLTTGDCDDMRDSIRGGEQMCDPSNRGVLVCSQGAWSSRPCPTGTVCVPEANGRGTCR